MPQSHPPTHPPTHSSSIYRAHRILSLSVEEVDGVMVANWSFKFADTPDEESPLRRGFFTVFPSLEAYNEGQGKFSKVSLLSHPPTHPPTLHYCLPLN